MLVLAGFLDSLLRGAVLVSLCLALGGVVWGLLIVRDMPALLRIRALRLLEVGALALAVGQLLLLALKATLLVESLGAGALGLFAGTEHAAAGITRAALALALAAAARSLARAPDRRLGWTVAGLLAVLLALASAWLTHANGRLEHRALLMALTVLHQAAAAVWLGGLVAARRRRAPGAPRARGGRALARAGRALLAPRDGRGDRAGGERDPAGLDVHGERAGARRAPATGPWWSPRPCSSPPPSRWRRQLRHGPERGLAHPSPALRARLPRLVEAEAILLVMIVFTASALSAQPPAIDLPVRRARHRRRGRGGVPPQGAVPRRRRRWTRCAGIGRRRPPGASAPWTPIAGPTSATTGPASSCSR